MIKAAGVQLKEAVVAARAEQEANIGIAINNRNAFFTGEGEARGYKTAAFRRMIQLSDELIGVALDGE